MSNPDRDSLSLAALEQALAETDPAALLVPPRILRRVIKQHARIGGIGLRVPHRKVYVLHREALLAIVARDELDLAPNRELTDRVILIARPTAERLSTISASEALMLVWRLLFHARVHVALDELVTEGRLRPIDVRRRINEIGHTEFDEIRSVLRSEDLLLPPRDDVSTYIEFAAVYLELRYFVSGFLNAYFPSIENLERIDDIISRDVWAEAIFTATRLPGTPEDPDPGEALLIESSATPATAEKRPARKLSDRLYRRLAAAAERVAPLGNSVRSAILRFQASRSAGGEEGREARFAALEDLAQLARRFQATLGFSDAEAADWEQALAVLLDESSGGIWTPGMRLLYDLQRVCIDHERGVYALDLIGWLKSGCKKSIKRPLPGQRDVLIYKHLRGASNRLPSVPIVGRARLRLGALLQSALHRAEGNLRAYFKPLINEAFDQIELLPHNLPEKVARQKLVDELLDRIVDRGFLTMGDLRDAISRNNLKLPDVTQVRELRYGDQVLQADKQLTPRLDGVYHRGEIYLRLPQQLSSLAFGTSPGRFLTQFVAIPFGGAYVTLEFIQHVVNAIRGHGHKTPPVDTGLPIELPTLPETPPDVVRINTMPMVLLVGLFILGLLHHAGFRRVCFEIAVTIGRGLRTVFYEGPLWLLEQPWMQAIVRSWPFQLAKQYLFKPLLISSLVWLFLRIWLNRGTTTESSVGVFLVVNVLLNSRLGRTVDEVVTDWSVNAWHRFRIHVVATFLRLIVDVFQGILETIERVLYAVDEWLRFRAGEDSVMTVIKAMLTVIWSVVNYVIRFFVNLLIEPQINPIKHFPVVTVSHKIILPTLPWLIGVLRPVVGEVATPLATAIVFLTPGIFGFLVWELKENWRLYAANRPKDLKPVQLGHHGETMLQFMRPGFRSGTLPKLYSRLRRANRRAYWTSNWKNAGKQVQALREVEEAVRRFVDRDLVSLLEQSRGWGGAQIAAGEIHLGINRIAIELYSPDLGEDSLCLAFDEQSDWLVAGILARGWLEKLLPERRKTLENALAGFYKMAGVDLVREEIESQLDPREADYDITDAGLVAWQGTAAEPRLLCNLHDGDSPANWTPPGGPRRWPLDPKKLLFSNQPITWASWVTLWQRDQDPTMREGTLLEKTVLLPGV